MNPLDRTSLPHQGTTPNPAAARESGQLGQMTVGMRERLEFRPEGDRPVASTAQRVDVGRSPGLPDNPFAAAAEMQQQRRIWPSVDSVRDPRPPGELVDVMVSVSDNQIGSIYLSDGRMRTTHLHGPESIRHEEGSVQRFNVDFKRAYEAFLDNDPNARAREKELDALPVGAERKKLEKALEQDHKVWVVDALRSGLFPPDWAQPVSTPQDVPEIGTHRTAPDHFLLEVIYRGPFLPPKTHLSRGELVRMTLPADTLRVIGDAVSRSQAEPDSAQRNQVFSTHIAEHADHMAKWFR